jgi:hypothetical protein
MVTGNYDGFYDEDVFRGDAVDLTGINRVDLQDRRGIFVRIKPKIQNGSSGYLALITNPLFFLCAFVRLAYWLLLLPLCTCMWEGRWHSHEL